MKLVKSATLVKGWVWDGQLDARKSGQRDGKMPVISSLWCGHTVAPSVGSNRPFLLGVPRCHPGSVQRA